MLLEEFDPQRSAIIDPGMICSPIEGFPETVISIFSRTLFEKLLEVLPSERIAYLHDVDGMAPVYAVQYAGKRFGYIKARLGGPACTGSFEDAIAYGAKRILLLGNCGVLDRNIEDCGIIIPTAAIRDEGTSYHYAPPSDLIPVNRKYTEEFEALCDRFGYPWVRGITWTTDAFYRETPAKAARRREMGAICVDMECASMQAMCDFRGVEFFQYFYAGDNLDHESWDPRSLSGHERLDDKEKIALLAFELAVRIEESQPR